MHTLTKIELKDAIHPSRSEVTDNTHKENVTNLEFIETTKDE